MLSVSVAATACSWCQVRNRNSEEYNVLKIQLEGIIEELERHFEQVRLPGWHKQLQSISMQVGPARLSS